MAALMNAVNSISGKMAECYITINGIRYNFMSMTNFEAKIEKNKIEVPILGKPGKGHKANGWVGTFEGTMHYNTSIMRRMLQEYKEGIDTYFTITVSNEDPTSEVGSQTVSLLNCNLDGGVLAKFDAESDDSLTEDVSGTFDDFEMTNEFLDMPGFSE